MLLFGDHIADMILLQSSFDIIFGVVFLYFNDIVICMLLVVELFMFLMSGWGHLAYALLDVYSQSLV